MSENKFVPTVVFDFDGVIHSYTSGWKGEGCAPDLPVPGVADLIDKLRERGYQVVVVSTRCYKTAGIMAIQNYLNRNGIKVDGIMAEKPPAVCYIDVRAIRFTGETEKLYDEIVNFQPWNKRAKKKSVWYDYEVNVGSGCCIGSVLVPEDATDDEIRLAIMDDLYDVNYHRQEETPT